MIIYVENPAGMAYLRSWEGPVGREMSRRIRDVEYFARAAAPVRTGALKASIRSDKRYTRGGNLIAKVGVNAGNKDRVGYGIYQHEGTKPHIITPKKKGGKLKFFWKKAGRVVYRDMVRHPGTKANPYLTRFMRRLTR